MANIKKSAEELIGRTPLMELVNYEKAAGVTDAVIWRSWSILIRLAA